MAQRSRPNIASIVHAQKWTDSSIALAWNDVPDCDEDKAKQLLRLQYTIDIMLSAGILNEQKIARAYEIAGWY